jgi:hypothetical protein
MAWSALLILILGLQSVLVVCSGPHCAGRIELAHAAGSCCQEHHTDLDHGDDGEGADLAAGHGRCTDVAFPTEPALRPATPTAEREQQKSPVTLTIAEYADRVTTAAAPRPPTTGPPRADRRTALRANTVLRL